MGLYGPFFIFILGNIMKKLTLLLAFGILYPTFPIVSLANQVQHNQQNDTQYHCDGRQYCAEMKTCDEARYFNRYCPNVKMDGDRDGKPCERRCGS